MKKKILDFFRAWAQRGSDKSTESANMHTSPSRPTPKKRLIPITRYLVYFVIVTTTITGISLSRYATALPVDTPSRVAEFNVSVSPHGWSNDDKSGHVTGGKVTYTFLVQNNSEVAVRARLINATTGDPILSVTVADVSWESVSYDANGWFTLSPKGTSGDTRYVSTSFSDTVGNGTGAQYKMRIEYEQID